MTDRHKRYPKPDGKYTFDKLSGVFLTGNATRDDAPSHIRIQKNVPREVAEAWQWMCPAGVYEVPEDAPENGNVDLIVNPSNCVQCGAITAKGGRLTPPEGGDGPLYQITLGTAPRPGESRRDPSRAGRNSGAASRALCGSPHAPCSPLIAALLVGASLAPAAAPAAASGVAPAQLRLRARPRRPRARRSRAACARSRGATRMQMRFTLQTRAARRAELARAGRRRLRRAG